MAADLMDIHSLGYKDTLRYGKWTSHVVQYAQSSPYSIVRHVKQHVIKQSLAGMGKSLSAQAIGW